MSSSMKRSSPFTIRRHERQYLALDGSNFVDGRAQVFQLLALAHHLGAQQQVVRLHVRYFTEPYLVVVENVIGHVDDGFDLFLLRLRLLDSITAGLVKIVDVLRSNLLHAKQSANRPRQQAGGA